jgi:microcin C transport system substrate-binding protein
MRYCRTQVLADPSSGPARLQADLGEAARTLPVVVLMMPCRSIYHVFRCGLAACVLFAVMAFELPRAGAAPVHGLAWGDQPRYVPGFSHFDYVNPAAPRTGSINLNGFGSFDKLNPFTLKGIAAEGMTTLMFETLAEASWDEPFSMYGLLAESIDHAPDGLSITFVLRSEARFSNGDPVTAEDVVHSYRTLMGREAHPRFRQYFADVAEALALDARTVRFRFHRKNHEIHMIVGSQLPVFSRKWGSGKAFSAVVQDPPIASGPYLIERSEFGRSISYRRNPDWWAAGLNVRRGMFNFERITYKYFKDETARLEGFKAGEFDWIYENSARNWARGHTGPRFNRGDLVKREFAHSNAAGMQGFALNTRRPQFVDVRAREALSLAMDFEWMNRQIFYGQYRRSPSYFTNSDMAAQGRPGADELALLEPLRAGLPHAVFGEVPLPAVTDPPSSLRENLRRAQALLAEAGWRVADDGLLRNASGEAFSFEILTYSKALERVAVPWVRNLEKLGISARMRVTDPALYTKRVDDFEFDVVVHVFSASQTPGNELVERFTSAAADEKGADNVAGVRDPAIDALVKHLLASSSRAELVVAARSIDRVLRHGHYMVPHFHAATHRVSFSSRLAHPERLPLYYDPRSWLLKTWWVRPEPQRR